MVRLDAIRQQRATWVRGGFDNRTADQDYAGAFAEAGLGRQGDDPKRVAARVRAAAVKSELVAALDDWAARTADPKRRGWLLGVARRADPDVWRDHFRKAVHLDPQSAPAHTDLGNALKAAGRLDQAIPHLRQAIRIDPASAAAHTNLGNALHEQGRPEEAIDHFRQAVCLNPRLAAAHHNLGYALDGRGRRDEAIRHFRHAVALDPTFAYAHFNLGLAYLRQGRFTRARAALERCLELLPQRDRLRPVGTQRLHQCKRMLTLEKRLPALLRGEAEPAGAAERIEYARLCRYKQLYRASAQFFLGATLAGQSYPHGDPASGSRYNAACCAALAGTGQGHDAAPLGAAERSRWRRQALDWLRADLDLWTKKLQTGKSEVLALVQRQLRHWQQDPDLASVRDREALARLPASERRAWSKFWAEVAGRLEKKNRSE